MDYYGHKSNFEYEEDEKPDIIVKVKNLLGKEQKYSVRPNDEIKKLNRLVHATFEISPRLQCLVCDGVILEEGKTLKDYNIGNGAQICLVIK